MSICVNTSSNEFIATAERLNISKAALEVIVHEFMNTEGNEESFPSDSYILDKLTPEPVVSTSTDIDKVWEASFKQPITVSSKSVALAIKEEALKYFNPESIYIKETYNGEYKVSVGELVSFTERQNILKNAPRNEEGKLLAPNGEVSNLSEDLYVTVRTKAFKEWFGDWEVIANDNADLASISNLRKINVDSFLKAVDSKLEKDFLTTGYLNRESVDIIKKLFDLSKVKLYQGDIKGKGLSYYTGAIVLNTMPIEEAAKVFVHEVIHSYTTYAYDTDVDFRKEIDKYHKIALEHEPRFSKDVYEFMANSLEPNHMATLLDIPSENNGSNLLKDIINSFVKHIRQFFKNNETKGKRTLFHDVIETIYNHKRNNVEFINNVSKVVDENGEPLVVYHGGSSKNIEVFDIKSKSSTPMTKKLKKKFYFTSNKFAAEQYAKSREYRQAIVKARNMEAMGIEYNEDFIPKENSDDFLYPVFLNFRNPVEIDALGQYISSVPKKHRDLIDNSENAIITNINESTGYFPVIVTDYLTNNPNQIKSADGNIGTYSRKRNNIYYQKVSSREQKENTIATYYLSSPSFSNMVSSRLAATVAFMPANLLGTKRTYKFTDDETAEDETRKNDEVKDFKESLKERFLGLAQTNQYRTKNGAIVVEVSYPSREDFAPLAIDKAKKDIYKYTSELSQDELNAEYNRIIQEEDARDFVEYYINPKKIEEITNQIIKKSIYKEQFIRDFIQYLDSIPNTQEDNIFVADAVRWVKNGSLPNFSMYGDDIREKWNFLRAQGVDTQRIKTAEQLLSTANVMQGALSIAQDGEILTKEDIAKRYNKFTYLYSTVSADGETVDIYDVEDSYEGRQQVAQVLADTTPKNTKGEPISGSPWCLSTYNYNKDTKVATPTESSGVMWNTYSQGSRQISFSQGKPLAFNSSKESRDEWWDFADGRDHNWEGYSTISEIKVAAQADIVKQHLTVSQSPVKVEVIPEAIIYYIVGEELINTKTTNDYSDYILAAEDTNLSITSELTKGQLVLRLSSPNQTKNSYLSSTYAWTSEGKVSVQATLARVKLKGVSYEAVLARGIWGTPQVTLYERLKTDSRFPQKRNLDIPQEAIEALTDTLKAQVSQASLETVQIRSLKDNEVLANKILTIINKFTDTYVTPLLDASIASMEAAVKESQVSTSTREDPSILTKSKNQERLNQVREYLIDDSQSVASNTLRNSYESEYQEVLNPQEEEYQTADNTEYTTAESTQQEVVTPADVDTVAEVVSSTNIAALYNEQIRKPFNKALSKKLRAILKKYHFEIIDDALMDTFGDDVLGATDLLQKIVYLASKGDLNAITEPEEFAHSFIALMGNRYRLEEGREKNPENRLYSQLRDLVEQTSIYKQVFDTYKDTYVTESGNPNLAAIKEEALGQALAAILLNRAEVRSKEDSTFFNKLRRWFNSVIKKIKAALRSSFNDTSINIQEGLTPEENLISALNEIADDILDGTYVNKYLKKLNDKGYKRVDVASSIKYDIKHNHGRMLATMRNADRLGAIVTGSLAYRAQGTVYRDAVDTLHDLDIIVPLNVHNLQNMYPSIARNHFYPMDRQFWNTENLSTKIRQTDFYRQFVESAPMPVSIIAAYTSGRDVIANLILCDNQDLVEKFKSLEGNFNTRMHQLTEAERQQLYLVDLFFKATDSNDIYREETYGIAMAGYRVPFESKFKMGRAKDIYDYQNFNPNHRYYYRGSANETLYQKVKKTTPEEAERAQQQFVDRTARLNAQIDNLKQSTLLTSSDIREIAEETVYWLSERLTEYQDNPEALFNNFPVLKTNDWATEEDKQKDLDVVSSKTRAQIVTYIGVDNFMAFCKESVFTPQSEMGDGRNAYINTRSKRATASLLKNNFSALITLASDVFTTMEGFSIVNVDSELATTEEALSSNNDNFNTDDSEDSDDILENEGNLQEHWQVEFRTRDAISSMSQLVKNALMRCYELEPTERYNEDGTPQYRNVVNTKVGLNKRIPIVQTTQRLLRWTQGSLTLSDMISKLEEKKASNPWLTQLLDRLTDTSGKEADFQSQFFGVFCRHFQSYSIVKYEDGKYSSIPVNEHPALKDAMSSIVAQYNIGEHPLFTNEEVNKDSFETLETISKALQGYQSADFNTLNMEEVARNIAVAATILGYPVAEDDVILALNKAKLASMSNSLYYIVDSLKKVMRNKVKDYNPFKYKGEDNIRSNTSKFISPLTDLLEDTAVSSFFDSGKMYQSYVTPSYMTKLMNKFALSGKEFEDFINEEYGQYEWFRSDTSQRFDKKSSWRNVWLRTLVSLPAETVKGNVETVGRKDIFKHKVQLNFNKHNYMRNMSDSEYALSIITEYFSGDEVGGIPTAWYRVPMLSNKPSSEYIKFIRYTGPDYQMTLTKHFKSIFDQELSRIQTVRERALSKDDPKRIKNFDDKGDRFHFLPFFNAYIGKQSSTEDSKVNTELGRLLNKKLSGKELTPEEELSVYKEVSTQIAAYINSRADSIIQEWKSKGIVEGAKKIEGITSGQPTDESIENALREFVWNDTFASMNILQLTITDPAYYKDAEDLQKRLAQIHAPGIRANINATDYNGNRVSDGKFRTIVLTDFDDFISNIVENVNIVFDRKIEQAKTEDEKKALRALKESLTREEVRDTNGKVIQEAGAFRQINVADAEGYSSPTSYRKKAFLFGKWSREAEDIYQKLKKGTYNYRDLQTAFQPLKPFVYSQIPVDAGVQDAPMSKLKLAVQFKNSEYLLIMADALLRDEETGRPNLLRAIYDVMEESADTDSTRGIDTVQFESTTKSGLHGKIDIKQYQYIKGGETAAKRELISAIYNEDGSYNTDYVYEIPVEDYCLQQEVPEHFKDHYQAHGSQGRYIIPSDLESVDYLGNPVTYDFMENGEERKLTAEEFKKEYEENIAANIRESIDTISKELGLGEYYTNKKDRNLAISRILQREILSSPRYGVDLLQACSVDVNTGEFRIPLGDPIQSKRVEQLLNSIIKNRINKQEIAGGPIVQVSNFGTSRELNIRFNSKEGGLLLTKEEFEASGKEGTYESYIKENQAGIAYFEVLAPIYMNELFEQFADEKGNIDIAAIEEVNPELLKLVGYRIPTEDKYSMAPLKIVGFLPREAGDGIMLPNDITLLNGSDFDVDKMYIMRKEIDIVMDMSYQESLDYFTEYLLKSGKASSSKEATRRAKEFLRNPMDATADPDMRRKYLTDVVVTNEYTEGTPFRNNKTFDMTWAVLTNETTADKMLNPGGFNPQKRMGYMVAAYKNKQVRDKYSWEDLQAMEISQLKDLCYTDKNLCFIDTQIQFYKQNSAAGQILGMFAVQKVAHAVLESNGICIDLTSALGAETFSIAGKVFDSFIEIDKKYDDNGALIGKTLGSLVASAADAVKDPVLNLMNINGTTANILNTMIRLGMPWDEAALFLSQNIISEVLSEYNAASIKAPTKLDDIIDKKIKALVESEGINDDNDINTEALSYEELVDGLRDDLAPSKQAAIAYKTLINLKRMKVLADVMRGPTYATRFNSISNAVGPLIIDNLIMEHKMDSFSEHLFIPTKEAHVSIDMDTIFGMHPILDEFSKAVPLARELFGNMPANSFAFRAVLNALPAGLKDTIYSDRKLLGQFSDFFQSFLLISPNNKGEVVVNPKELNYYINKFPAEFNSIRKDTRYTNNPFIQAIKLDTYKDKTSGKQKAILKIDTTGLDTPQKEKLTNGWADFYRVNPEMALKLFYYNFFRTGIGFSPKSFMALLPLEIKRAIPNYMETFSKLPSVTSNVIIDQFVRNNWDNNRLVPTKVLEKGDITYNNDNTITVNPRGISKINSAEYFKVKRGSDFMLYYKLSELLYMKVAPLGNNGEYLEISTNDIVTPLVNTVSVRENSEETTDTKTTTDQEEEANTTRPTSKLGRQISHATWTLLQDVYKAIGRERFNTIKALAPDIKALKKDEYKKEMAKAFKTHGLEFNDEKFEQIYTLFCN